VTSNTSLGARTYARLLFRADEALHQVRGGEAPTEFRRDRSRKDGRYPQCKACERLWRQENSEHLADYHRRWQQANRDKTRAQDRRYRERKRQDPRPLGAKASPGPPLSGAEASPTLQHASRDKRRLSPLPSFLTASGKANSQTGRHEELLCTSHRM
jgi:hypothetical protein